MIRKGKPLAKASARVTPPVVAGDEEPLAVRAHPHGMNVEIRGDNGVGTEPAERFLERLGRPEVPAADVDTQDEDTVEHARPRGFHQTK